MNMNNFCHLTVDKELAQSHAHEPASGSGDDASVDHKRSDFRTDALRSHSLSTLEPNDNELGLTPQFLKAIENGEDAVNSFGDVVQFFTEIFSEITNRVFGQLGGWTHSWTDENKTTLAVDIKISTMPLILSFRNTRGILVLSIVLMRNSLTQA